MISGDIHMMAYDTGSIDMVTFGEVPLFQCAPLDKKDSCEKDTYWNEAPQFHNG